MNTIFLTDIDKAVFGVHDTLAGRSDLGVLTAKQHTAGAQQHWAGLSASVGAVLGCHQSPGRTRPAETHTGLNWARAAQQRPASSVQSKTGQCQLYPPLTESHEVLSCGIAQGTCCTLGSLFKISAQFKILFGCLKKSDGG